MRFRDERGAALVEMAIGITLLLLLVFGMIEFGRVMYIRDSLNLAAREGARLAAVTPSATLTASTNSITARAISSLPSDLASANVVVTSDPAGYPTGVGATIKVVVTYRFQTILPQIIPQLQSIDLTGEASMRYEY